jgi:hypothetical protein
MHSAGGEWTEEFKAWVWEPPYWRVRVRGLSNAVLEVRPGGFTLRARHLYERISGWREITYEWPAVVLETLLPFRSPGLLFEMSGQLARCGLRYEAGRLRPALNRAGISIIEVKHWGWEAPRPVVRTALGEHVAEVPAAVIATRR